MKTGFIHSFLILLSLFSGQGAQALNSIACPQFFSSSTTSQADPKNLSNYKIVRMTYEPAILSQSGTKIARNQVLIEVHTPGMRQPLSQVLLPYIQESSGLPYPYAKDTLHEAGLQAIYQNYGDRVPTQIVEMVTKAEASLSLDRQATFLASATQDEILGFMRVFDGSTYQAGIRSITSSKLPLEAILGMMGKSTEAINDKRASNAVFEVGKYYLNDVMSGPQAKSVKRDMCLWFIDFLNTRGAAELEHSFYFAHVASETHRIAYKRFFGFTEVASEKSHGLAEHEYILEIRGDQFLKNLLKTLAQLEQTTN